MKVNMKKVYSITGDEQVFAVFKLDNGKFEVKGSMWDDHDFDESFGLFYATLEEAKQKCKDLLEEAEQD